MTSMKLAQSSIPESDSTSQCLFVVRRLQFAQPRAAEPKRIQNLVEGVTLEWDDVSINELADIDLMRMFPELRKKVAENRVAGEHISELSVDIHVVGISSHARFVPESSKTAANLCGVVGEIDDVHARFIYVSSYTAKVWRVSS